MFPCFRSPGGADGADNGTIFSGEMKPVQDAK